MKGHVVIIVAAGRGTRLQTEQGAGSNPPDKRAKQYLLLDERCVLAHTAEQFFNHDEIAAVQIVIHRDDHALYETMISHHPKLLPAIDGGKTRQDSVRMGLQAVRQLGYGPKVLIHDAARPFVEASIIDHVLAAIAPGCGSLPALPIADTVKKAAVQGNGATHIQATVDRSNLYGAQTPQGFMLEEITELHETYADRRDLGFTDDASLFETADRPVTLVEGSAENFKITTFPDLERARMNVQSHPFPDVRTGNGYDVHALEPGDGVILCGIRIPFERKLKGHSDADVGLHALTDALLATIASGDIGDHFPPTDPQYKNANSDQFLIHACTLVRNMGGIINHVDITLVCEAPKIGPHRDEMRQKIAQLCEIDVGRVSVKATTNEKLGFLGRQEGIAAIATATAIFEQKTRS